MEKGCINKYRSFIYANLFDSKSAKRVMQYSNPDLSQFAKEAFEAGEDYFYAEPDGAKGYRLCEPKYVAGEE